MTQMIPFEQVAPLANPVAASSAFTDGINLSSLKALSTRGKVFRVRIGDEEMPLLDANKSPRTAVTAVMVAARGAVSKKLYEPYKGRDQQARMLCGSRNGIVPDNGDAIVSSSCVTCPNNVFGSSQTGRGKACMDYKRVVLAFYSPDSGFIREDGEIVTLRLDITGGSFKAFKKLMSTIHAKGLPVEKVVVEFRIDPEPEYPSLLFTPVGQLPEGAYAEILDLAQQDDVQAEVVVSKDATPVAVPQLPVQASVPAPAPAPAPTLPPPSAPTPEPQVIVSSDATPSQAVKDVMGAMQGW